MRRGRCDGTSSPAGRAATFVVSATLGGWALATLACQHPSREFERLRVRDVFGVLLPDWRFFAPNPGQHDYSLVYRVLGHDDAQSTWYDTPSICSHSWRRVLFFPDRRREKALVDVANDLIAAMRRVSGTALADTVAFVLLRNAVEARIRSVADAESLPKGFQFVLGRDGGYDDGEEPQCIFASQFIALAPDDA
jgi:hypothetical protein